MTLVGVLYVLKMQKILLYFTYFLENRLKGQKIDNIALENWTYNIKSDHMCLVLKINNPQKKWMVAKNEIRETNE